jgi:hypothetical protein
MNVVSVIPSSESGERWIEVEDRIGDVRKRVQLSGFLHDVQVKEGDAVRVATGDFAYEVVSDEATKQSQFLKEVEFQPNLQLRFADVKGQREAVTRLQVEVEKLVDPSIFPTCRSGGGALGLAGPPGQGKTMLAETACAYLVLRVGEERARLFFVRGAQFKNKFVGESSARVRELFRHCLREAKRGNRAIIVIDEADAALSNGYFDNTGVSRSISAAIQTYLSGPTPLENVLVLTLSNRMTEGAGGFDSALLRPGRLGGDSLINMGRLGPDAFVEIVESTLAKKRPELINGATKREYSDAVTAALQVGLGTAIVGKNELTIPCAALVGGSAATSSVDASERLLDTHVLLTRCRGIDTPYRTLPPALLFHGILRTLNAVLLCHSGASNVHRAREFFQAGGDLICADEAKSLTEVRCFPLEQLTIPDQYDLSPMRELEE